MKPKKPTHVWIVERQDDRDGPYYLIAPRYYYSATRADAINECRRITTYYRLYGEPHAHGRFRVRKYVAQG